MFPPKNYDLLVLKVNENRHLRFQYAWVKKYLLLVYSKKKNDGAYCKHCVVFSKHGGVSNQL